MEAASFLFSIVIPTYNRADLIDKTLTSVLHQDFPDFEILIVDDGSTDNTGEIVRKFTDARIHYYKKENGERGAARNFGAQKARGSYVNFFDSDDLMYPSHLSVARGLILSSGQPEFFHLAYDHRLVDGSVIERVNDFDDTTVKTLLFNNKLSCNGVFLRRDIALQFPFEENRVLASSEDWELWIRLLSRFRLFYSNEVTSSVVNHDQRSLRTIRADKVVQRDLFFIEKLKLDDGVQRSYNGQFNKFIAERYSFFMLSFAEQGLRREVMRWAKRAALIYPPILLTKRFLASIKNAILS